jgi:hypothetical protein
MIAKSTMINRDLPNRPIFKKLKENVFPLSLLIIRDSLVIDKLLF